MLDSAVFLYIHFFRDVLEKGFWLFDEFLGVEDTLGEVVLEQIFLVELIADFVQVEQRDGHDLPFLLMPLGVTLP